MQFTTLGRNITAIEVNGNFDDCQSLVKKAFLDKKLNEKMMLTSANSINVARFLPQMFYYFHAWAQAVNEGSNPDEIVVCVPSGNFGNISAGLMAKRMGLPVKRFIAANNANNIFYNYLLSGNYRPADSIPTIANAMDVGNPSNFARIMDLYSNSHIAVKEDISGATYSDTEIAQTLKHVYSGYNYLLDPHGAVGFRALEEQILPGETGIFLETAHPAKFKNTVEEIIRDHVTIPDKLTEFMKGEKVSHPLPADFECFKSFLLEELG